MKHVNSSLMRILLRNLPCNFCCYFC